MSAIENVSRREFLGGVFSTGAFVLAAQVAARVGVGAEPRRSAPRRSRRRSTRASISASSPTARSSSSRIAPRWAPASARRCRMVAADELEADWSRVTHRAGHRRSALRRPEHRRLAIDPRLLRSVPPRRRHGAVDAGERGGGAVERAGSPSARPQNHEVVHTPSGRRLGYGALVPAAAKLRGAEGRDAEVQAEDARGASSARTPSTYDQQDIVTGKAQFGLDIFRDGMVLRLDRAPAGARRHGPQTSTTRPR